MYQPGTIKWWQWRYEQAILAVRRRSSALRYIEGLQNFLSRFPDRKWPGDIYITDVADYRIERRKDGVSERTVETEIDTVRGFYDWLIDYQEVPTINPAKKPKKPSGAIPV